MLEQLNSLISKLNFEINGIIHVGAGSGAELRNYCNINAKNFLMIEPDPLSYKKLLLRKIFYSLFHRMNIVSENCLITDKIESQMEFKIMNVKDCNSIYDLHIHKKIYPKIFLKKTIKIKSETLNNLFKNKYDIKNYNFINIDIQGAELLAFQGANNILDRIEGIYTEVNFEELYKGCALIDQVDFYLAKFNFKRVYTNNNLHSSWGDALYIKN